MTRTKTGVFAAGAFVAAMIAAVLALCAPINAWALDEKEPNNTFNTAQSIKLGTTVYGSGYQKYDPFNGTAQNQKNVGDPDFFVVNVPSQTQCKLTYCNDSYGSDAVGFRLFDRYYEFRDVFWKYGRDIKPQSTTITLDAGRNYIYVEGPTTVAQYHFKLTPIIDKTYISKLTPYKKAATVKWAKRLSTTKYQVRYSTKSSMSGAKVKSVSGSKTSLKISKLKKNKKYYFQVRVVKKLDGKNFYSNWSVKKSVKAK